MKTFKDYGAIGDGVTDDTVAIQTALNVGESLFIDAGNYLITSTILIYSPIELAGEGNYSCIITNGSFTSPVVIQVWPTAGLHDGLVLRNFRIATTAIAISIATLQPGQSLRNVLIDRLIVDAGTNLAITTNNNQLDGLVSLKIKDCIIVGGIFLAQVGDTVAITGNQISGSQIGLFASFVQGATNIYINNNNFATCKEQVYLINPVQATVSNNQIENANYGYSGSTGAAVFVTGALLTNINNNSINTAGNCNNIYLAGCSNSLVSRNYLLNTNTKFHVWDNTPTSTVYYNNSYLNLTTNTNGLPGRGTTNNSTLTSPAFLTS